MSIGRKKGKFLSSMLCALMVLLDGCGVFISSQGRVMDEPFTEKKVLKIHNNETMRGDILHQFGPPLAVGRPGSVMKVPHWGKIEPLSADVPADDYVKRFDRSKERIPQPLVYYYEAARLDWTEYIGFVIVWPLPLVIPFPLSYPSLAERNLTVMRLWILIDEGNGKVIDHQFEKTVEGKPVEAFAVPTKKPVRNEVGAEIP